MRNENCKHLGFGKTGIVVISRGHSSEENRRIATVLEENGLDKMEITFDAMDEKNLETLRSINAVRETVSENFQIGAGTVLTREQVREAKKAGAEFILSPNVNNAIIEECMLNEIFSIPGATTPSEIISAYEAGANMVKLFPASAMGYEYLKDILSPLNHIPIMAVGGITLENIPDFLKTGIKWFGIGSSILKMELVKMGDFGTVGKLAAHCSNIVKGGLNEKIQNCNRYGND